MKLSCTQENLSKGLSLVNRTITTKSTLPILSNVLVKTDKGRLKLSATDLEIGINSWIGAKVEKEGTIAVPGRLISEFVTNNDDRKIEIETQKGFLSLNSDKYQAQIKSSNPDEFPLIPTLKKQVTVSIGAAKFQKGIDQVVPACAIDESRPTLAGVLFKISQDHLKLVATDSYRLAEKQIKLVETVDEEKNIIVPAKTMHELSRVILSSNPTDVKITFSENQIQFNLDDNIEIISRLIEGSFPDYEQILPNSWETQAQLPIDQFENAIKVSSLFVKDTANNIKLTLQPDETVIINAQAAQVGQNIAKFKGKIKGSKAEASFNAKFLLDALSVMPTQEITFEIMGKLNPGVLKPKDHKDYLHIIMPLRMEE